MAIDTSRATILLNASDAAKCIPDNATVAVSGGGYRVVPEALLEAVEGRFLDAGSPKGLTLVAVSMLERTRAGRGGEGTGLNRLAKEGLLQRVVCSSYSRAREREINRLILDNKVSAYNLPMGTVVQWLRSIAAGHPGLLTSVGLGTFIDPRLEGGRMNSVTTDQIARVVELEREEMLFYPSMPIDVALIKGTTGDERGNVYLEREAFTHGLLYTAMAAKASGGRVIAQVNRLAEVGSVHPRMGRVPGSLVDAVVVVPEVWEDEQDPALTGEIRAVIARQAVPLGPRAVIARRALREFPPHSAVNLGAGIPMYEVPQAAHFEGRDDVYFSIEQGPFGGLPMVGGVARNPELILDQLEVFDYYEGGGPDFSCLSFGQIDALGNVNVSRFGDMMPGCGGFPNITHRISDLVFCGTLTTGGLDVQIVDAEVRVIAEGRTRRLVERVDQVTFNGQRALGKRQNIMVITERAVLRFSDRGWVLTEIAPGVDLEADVVNQIEFSIEISPNLAIMDRDLFVDK